MERETVRIRATQDVTVVVPAGEEVVVFADHAENIIAAGYAESLEDAAAPRERKPAAPRERKPAAPRERK
jgi:hypothetical protein